ncbi:hypothetical protein [Anaerolentibacter hominis]|uniref:hypothetical protein n=1 Tax=Anaerolentibacter hominis TaxID=3079009 RepID=UPI0031B8531A
MKRTEIICIFLLFCLILVSCKNRDADKTNTMDKIISIELDELEAGDYVSYGPYSLKQGTRIKGDFTWENTGGNVYLSVASEQETHQSLIHSGTADTFLNEELLIKQDGVYYIYLGNQSEGITVRSLTGTIRRE